jgi:hypothetical protein
MVESAAETPTNFEVFAREYAMAPRRIAVDAAVPNH